MNYLYNGVELPAPPAGWNKNSHPYALINQDPMYHNYWFRAYSDPVIVLTKGTVSGGFADGEAEAISCELNGEDWGEPYAFTTSAYTVVGEVWTNHDILNLDGTTYLAASDPIPVSSFTPDPISMTMGWLVGRRIAGQRK